MKKGRKSAWDEKIEPYLDTIKSYARNGHTERQIAAALGIHISTFARYKSEKKELQDALRDNKEIADLNVENSLYVRAIGCEIIETIEDRIYIIDNNGKAIPTNRIKVRKIKKEIPPDPGAAKKWLTARKGDVWRNKKEFEITGMNGGPLQWQVEFIDAE